MSWPLGKFVCSASKGSQGSGLNNLNKRTRVDEWALGTTRFNSTPEANDVTLKKAFAAFGYFWCPGNKVIGKVTQKQQATRRGKFFSSINPISVPLASEPMNENGPTTATRAQRK